MPVAYNQRDIPLAKNSGNASATSEVLSFDFTGVGAVAAGSAWLYAGAAQPVSTLTGTMADQTYNGIPGKRAGSASLYEYTNTTDYGLQVGTGDFQIGVIFSTGPSLPTANASQILFEVRNASGTAIATIICAEFAANGWYMTAAGLGLGSSSGAVYYGVNKTVIFWVRRRAGVISAWTQEASAGSALTRRYADGSNSVAWDSASATRVRFNYRSTTQIDVALHNVRFWSGSFDDSTTQTIGRDWWALDANSAPADALAITSPATGTSIPTTTTISGTYTGTAPIGIEVQHGAGAWVALTATTISGGAWTGSATLTAAASAALRARYSDNTAVVSADVANITVTADAIAFSAPIDITQDAVSYRVFQRNGSNQATMRLRGTYSGTPTNIEYQWNGGAWAVLAAGPSGGTFSASVTLTGPAQGTLSVRFSNATTVSASLAAVGVGDVFIAAGQSNHDGAATNYVPPVAPSGNPGWAATVWSKQHEFKAITETAGDKFGNGVSAIYPAQVNTNAGAGSYFGALGTIIMASGVPCMFVPCAKGSTTIDNWTEASPTTSTLYGAMLAAAQAIGGHKAVLWWQGEAEMAGSGTASAWASKMAAIIAAWAAAGQTSKWLLVNPCFAANGSTANGTTLRAQVASMSSNGNVLGVVDMDSPSPAYTGIHYDTPVQIATVANRVGTALGYSGVSVRTVTLALTTDGSTAAASLAGLKWAFFDQVTPDSFLAPAAKGVGESTDGSGSLVVDVTGTALSAGQVGWLIVTNSDGTTTQSPAAKAFSGPVVVA